VKTRKKSLAGEVREGSEMGEKMGEEKMRRRRETAIFRICSPRQNAQKGENNLLKYFKSPHLSVWV
jgi:hypothetical protein